MKKRDLIQLLSRFHDDEEIYFDDGGVAGWQHDIACAATVQVRRDQNGGIHKINVLAEDRSKLAHDYRRFGEFSVLMVAYIDRCNQESNGTLEVDYASDRYSSLYRDPLKGES